MPFFRLVILSSILLSGSAVAQRWELFSSDEDAFRLMAPSGFGSTVEEVDFLTEYEIVVPSRIYSVEDDTGTYTLTVVDYRDAQQLHEERIAATDGAYISIYGQVDVRASVAFAAKMIRDRAESIQYDAYHYIARVDGHQLQTTNSDGTRTFAAIYLHRSKLYVIEAVVIASTPRGGMFQQTLDFVGHDGNRIWYDEFRDAYKVLPASGETPLPPTRED